MRNTFSLFACLALVGVLASGCIGAQEKLGRGMSNTMEIVRGGETWRTMENTAMFDSPDAAATTGFVKGFSRTLARTGIGIYEVVTFPLPPYRPIFTDTFSPQPVYPMSYKPGLVADSIYDTDTYSGYSGGDVAPIIPGSKFRIFDTH
jgi:putative exosortase-associated protein (TIGR04073 family)